MARWRLFWSFWRPYIRILFLWPVKESCSKARGDGGTLSAPSGGRMRHHNLFFCVHLCSPCAQCGFVPYVCQKAKWERASSGERTMLCVCMGRPPSISPVKIGDLGVQLEGFRFSQKQHCSFQSKNGAIVSFGTTWRRRREASGWTGEE